MNELGTLRPIAACHQPNFFPWLGYFHKIRWSDTFIFLDDVFLQKTRGGVTNRVAVVVGGQEAWLTAPLDRSYSGNLEINRVQFAPSDDWRRRTASTVKMHYNRATHFAKLGPIVLDLINDPEPSLAEFNMRAIRAIADLLELRPQFVRSSTLNVATTSSERLAELVANVGARTYLAGAGARAYQDDAVFHRRGLQVLAQGFRPPNYLRGGKPGPAGLSVIDALFWLGVEGTRELLEIAPGSSDTGCTSDDSPSDEPVVPHA
jgi:WbqC-like protein family